MKIGKSAVEKRKFTEIAQIPLMRRRLDDYHFAVGALHDVGAQEADIGGDAGAGGDHNHIVVQGGVSQPKDADDALANINPVSHILMKEARSQLP